MKRKERIRRAALICCHCARNLAYYRAGWKAGSLIEKTEYGATVNSNFVDLGLIEWCKIFGSDKEKHHWKNIISSKTAFKDEMLKELKISQKELVSNWKKVTTYRNTFLAHLDSSKIMYIPQLDITISTVFFYYAYLYKHNSKHGYFHDLPDDLEKYYEKCFKDASK